MFLRDKLDPDALRTIHRKILRNMATWCIDFSKMETGNDKLHTVIFSDVKSKPSFPNVVLEDHEYPILECQLDNGNRFLMTTERMISKYNSIHYSLTYVDYKGPDWDFYHENTKPIDQGLTRIFKYHATSCADFYYEIDSFIPAFFASRVVLFGMKEVVERVKHGTIEYFLSKPDE